MPLISVCLIAQATQNYDFLEDQDWNDVELVMAGEQEAQQKIIQSVYNHTSITEVKYTNSSGSSTDDNEVIQKCSGDYVIWLQKTETWSPDFLTQLKDFVREYKHTDTVLYGMGFTKNNLKTTFSTDTYPFLSGGFSLSKVLIYPYFFIPNVKFIWKSSIIREYGLFFDPSLDTHLGREAAFNLDYLTTVYQNNAYNEESYRTMALSFYLPLKKDVSADFLTTYQEKILHKGSIFKANIWSILYWKYLLVEQKLKKKLEQSDKTLRL
jgi:hypothetical protein